MQEKVTELGEWLRVMVMEPERAILVVFYQNGSGTKGQGDDKGDFLRFLAGNT